MFPKEQGLLIVVSAPSGAGKTTLCKKAEERHDNLFYSVSYTTRAPRQGEVNGKDYFFICSDEFKQMTETGQFLEYAYLHDNCYGTGRDETLNRLNSGLDVILDVDPQGAMQLKEKIDRAVFIYILPPSLEILEKRLRERNTDDDIVIEKRLAKAKSEIENYTGYDYILVNDDLNKAIQSVSSIIHAEKHRLERIDKKKICSTFGIPGSAGSGHCPG